jgi:GNAT superfamily N-acetyltransferase
MSEERPFIFSDLTLSRRLEKAEARSNVGFVEARASVEPASGACWIEAAGACAMFDGVDSPCTQTFGLGLFEEPSDSDFERIEGFFGERGAPTYHEVSPLADPKTFVLLNGRGYEPFEFTSVMFRPLRAAATEHPDSGVSVRLARPDEHELWAQTAARGWGEFEGLADFMLGLSRVSAARADALSFLAELKGQPVAAGALSICEGVALLAGASTVPEARRRGAQLALLDARLSYARDRGCDLAMMCAQPGSGSQRNAERHGFRIAYTRIKWRMRQGSSQ